MEHYSKDIYFLLELKFCCYKLTAFIIIYFFSIIALFHQEKSVFVSTFTRQNSKPLVFFL